MKEIEELKPLNDKIVPPFMEVSQDKGYGYYGTLLYDEVEDKIQCHICGELFNHLGLHVSRVHKVSSREYKDRFELNYSTALMTPTLDKKKAKLSEKNYKLIYEKLNSEEVKELAKIEAEQKRLNDKRNKLNLKKAQIVGKYVPKRYTIEMMNRYGTCPLQVSERFTQIIDELGKAPTWQELRLKDSYLLQLLEKRYKNYSNALKAFGYAPKINQPQRYTLEEIKKLLKLFIDRERRLPTARDTKRGGLPDRETLVKFFGDWWKVKEYSYSYLKEKFPQEAQDYENNYMPKGVFLSKKYYSPNQQNLEVANG